MTSGWKTQSYSNRIFNKDEIKSPKNFLSADKINVKKKQAPKLTVLILVN